MHTLASAGAGFLLAVLWFDLMFDVQVRGRVHGRAPVVGLDPATTRPTSPPTPLPPEVLDSIARYYRRVTTEARPMNRLVSVAMLATLGALVAELVRGSVPLWISATSLALAAGAVGLAAARTFRNAVTLGRGEGSAEERSRLARTIFRDHLYCFSAISGVLVLQLAG